MAKGKSAGLLGALFSQVRLRVLGLFFAHPDERYHLTQVIKLLGSGRGAVQRELEKLTQVGILNATAAEGRKLYQANGRSPIFDELRGLIIKTVGLHDPLRRALKPLEPRIAAAFVYGSIAKGEDTAKSDIDLMIVGQGIAYGDIYKALHKAEEDLRRPVNPNVMAPGEWRQKLAGESSFVNKVALQPKLFIVGTEDDLNRIGQSG